MGVLMGAHGGQVQCWVPGVLQEVLMGCSFGVRCGCSWWAGTTLGSWGAPGGAHGVLIQHEMAHHLAKGGTWVLMDACGVLVWHVMAHCSARGIQPR